jgi:pimeloyl-ACP methyl ester carboxylesterase
VETIRSKDGTIIAFDRLGDGPAVIVVGGATCDRVMTRPLAEQLASHFTVINYARRSRGDSGDAAPYAVELFMTTVGAPPEVIGQMRNEPWWAGMEAIAPTLAYDSEVMGDSSRGGTIPVDLVGRVTVPTLVLCGGASPAWMIDIGRQIADAMPNGQQCVLEGQEHVVAPEVLAPVVAEFFADWSGACHRT